MDFVVNLNAGTTVHMLERNSTRSTLYWCDVLYNHPAVDGSHLVHGALI